MCDNNNDKKKSKISWETFFTKMLSFNSTNFQEDCLIQQIFKRTYHYNHHNSYFFKRISVSWFQYFTTTFSVTNERCRHSFILYVLYTSAKQAAKLSDQTNMQRMSASAWKTIWISDWTFKSMRESCQFKRPANVEIDFKYWIFTQFFVVVTLIKSKFTAFDGLIFHI